MPGRTLDGRCCYKQMGKSDATPRARVCRALARPKTPPTPPLCGETSLMVSYSVYTKK